MLTDVLLCSLATTGLASLALMGGRRTPPTGGHRYVARRRVARWGRGGGGDVLAVLLAAVPAIALVVAGVGLWDAAFSAAICAALSGAWLARTRRWSVAAHLTWASAVTTGACFLGYTATWTLTSRLGATGLVGGAILWLLECAAYLLSLAYLWDLVDAVGSRSWHRRMPDGADLAARVDGPLQYVSIHVPTHNEPPDMVIDTLRSLLALDYPGFEVVVLDDNTDDEQLWRPVQRFCDEHPAVLRFHHLSDWPGYKSGALNYGLAVTDPRAELIGVVDADYLVEPDWLRATVPMFAEPRLGFVQSPQDYRGWEDSAYYRRLYHSYDYFFRVSQRSRDERGAAIFGGTMGLVRRAALVAVGGWDEWCITEDAELSLRLQKAGWSGRHVDASYGRGVMPLTFEALKGQRFRWCFGGLQILRLHWRSLTPWNRDEQNQLSRSQRLAYLCGGLQWYGDLLGLALLSFLLIAGVNIIAGDVLILRRFSPLLVIVVPALMVLAFIRAVGGVRRAGGGSWREALGALGIWLALGLTVARACVRGTIEPTGVFLRTPKTRGDTSLRESMRMNRAESALGALSVTMAAGVWMRHTSAATWLVGAMLAVAGAGYLAAPANSLAALRADLPERLRRRRNTDRARAWASGARGRRLSGAVVVLAAAAAAVVMLAPSTGPDSTPGLRQRAAAPAGPPDSGASSTPAGPGTSSPAPSSAPAPSPSTTTARTVPASRGASVEAASTPTASGSSTGSAPGATATSPGATATSPGARPSSPGARPTTTPSQTAVSPSRPAPRTTPAGRPTSTPTPTITRGKP
ncbi:MAG: glycosyltransferase [Jatrophihabitantaceae bacterium]